MSEVIVSDEAEAPQQPQSLDEIKAAVFNARSELTEIQQYASLDAYLNDSLEWNPEEKHFPHKSTLLDAVTADVERVYGAEVAEGVQAQLERNFTVETGGHLHLPRRNDTNKNEGFRINGMVFQGQMLMAAARRRRNHAYNISLSSGSIPPENLNGGGYLQLTPEVLFRLIPVRLKEGSQFLLPVIDEAKLKECEGEIAKLVKAGTMTEHQAEWNRDALQAMRGQSRLSDQIAAAHVSLMSKVLPSSVRQVTIDMDQFMPALTAKILRDPNSAFHRILADERLRMAFTEGQKDISTASGKNLPPFCDVMGDEKKGRSVHKNIAYNGDMHPLALAEQLDAGKIWPRTTTQYFAYLTECGLCPIGGMNQVKYSSELRALGSTLLRELGEHERADVVASLPSNKAVISPCWGMNGETGRTADFVDYLATGKTLTEEDLQRIVAVSGEDALQLGIEQLYMFLKDPKGLIEAHRIMLKRTLDQSAAEGKYVVV